MNFKTLGLYNSGRRASASSFFLMLFPLVVGLCFHPRSCQYNSDAITNFCVMMLCYGLCRCMATGNYSRCLAHLEHWQLRLPVPALWTGIAVVHVLAYLHLCRYNHQCTAHFFTYLLHNRAALRTGALTLIHDVLNRLDWQVLWQRLLKLA